VGTKGTHLTAVRDLNQLQPLSPNLNPFAAGQPITASVCQGGASYNNFPTSGINSGPVTVGGVPVPGSIASTPGIGPASPGYINMIVACTGNPGFVGANGSVLGISADSVRPYPGLSNIISVQNVADSEYEAFQGTLRETTGPVTLGIAYTLSHSLDDASDRSSANFANSLDIHSNHATSDFDQRQLLNISYIYDLPLLHLLDGFTHLLANDAASDDDDDSDTATRPDAPSHTDFTPVMKAALGGWQLTGITTFQTGTPFSVINAGSGNGTGAADNAGVGDGLGVGSYPDVIGNAHGPRPFVAPGLNEGPRLRKG
jgi:hypothetical protein